MNEITLIGGATGPGVGDAQDLGRPFCSGVVQSIVGGTATVKLQGSLDGTNWTDVATFTGNDAAEVTALRYMRGNVTAHTSGAVSLILGVN
ncbi:hypothetical protein [Rhodospira trueperi]|uniref:Uncharacterized protein n=1 Tax=Rhodospira trueperi TaxID=69960 RepID=A0A1G6X1Y4_9PROT|nr:hypothetical protein [Rhodospira trueperi]SDD72069.1 hypothetical protein SAMN05421720_101345 [Rhodospira trueperi]